MDFATLKAAAPLLIQGGFAVVSIVLSWVVYKLWQENKEDQVTYRGIVAGVQREKDDLRKEKDDKLAEVIRDKDAEIARITKEKDDLYKRWIEETKEDVKAQLELNTKVVEEHVKTREVLDRLERKLE